MSENNKKPEIANIDETGKVIINDPELAKMTEELTQDELDEVAGGLRLQAQKGNIACDSGC